MLAGNEPKELKRETTGLQGASIEVEFFGRKNENPATFLCDSTLAFPFLEDARSSEQTDVCQISELLVGNIHLNC